MLNFLLKPCIFVYKIVRSLFYGIYFCIYCILKFIYKFCYYFIYGITLPIRIFFILPKLKKENSKYIQNRIQKKELREQKKEKKRLKKEEIKKRKELIINAKLEKKEEKKKQLIEEKRQKEIKRIHDENIKKEQKALKASRKKQKKEEKKKLKEIRKIEQAKKREEKKLKKETSASYIKRKERKEKKKQLKLEKEEKKKQLIEEKRQKEIKRIHDENIKKEQKAFEASRKKHEKEEKKRLAKEKKEKRKQERIERKKKIEKKRANDTYVNENAEIEKLTFSQKLKKTLKKINNFPIFLSEKLKNNSFAKNRRNKKDINRQALLIDFNAETEPKSDVKLLYKYEAKDKNGNMVTGYFEAFSRVEVHSFLLSEGYEVYSIKTSKWITLFHGGASVNKTKFKNKDLIFLLTQLSTYLKAGIPLVEAIRILSKQFKKNKSYNRIFKSMIYELTMGESFSSAMEKQGKAFPKLLINMVKTSEMTGELPEVLDDMSEYFSQADETKKQMISALTYPSIVFVFAIGVITFVLLYVIPQFSEMYSSMDEVEIPAFTRIVISVSDFLKSYFLFVILVIILFSIIFVVCYKKIKSFRTLIQWINMHLPVIGTTIIYKEVTMFTKTFASLLSHNVSITECMELLNGITNNEIYKMLILDTITNLAKGGKISDAFEDHWAFPIPAYEMIVTGETTGELPEMMSKVSTYYQGLHREMVARIKTFVEPILTVFLTVMVGIIVIAIVIPMFNMYQVVSDM